MSDKKLSIEKSLEDFKEAYRAKRELIEREKEDFLFALGKQWSKDDSDSLASRKIKCVTDNRIQPNIFLLTGLERQNRTDFKAFPEGEEDTIKAEIASALFKNSIKASDFSYKSSEQFKDGITCGESHLELFLDNTYNLLNGKPNWKKVDGDCIFPEPGFREYDFSDARYVYKLTKDLSEDDLISLFPDSRKAIEAADDGKLNFEGITGGADGSHRQPRDYPKSGSSDFQADKKKGFDLLERYYKKFVEKHYIGDKQTGKIQEAEGKEKAEGFVADYQEAIRQEQEQFMAAEQQFAMAQQNAAILASQGLPVDPIEPPIQPPPMNPERFVHFTRNVPELWYFAHTPGIEKPLADEKAWFYPKWKSYPFIPFFARFSTAPITGEDRHLLVQGVVYPVKNVQEKHNKAETLKLLHLNSATNSGWLSEEDAWVDPKAVKNFGATPGINLEYKKGSQKPERVFPMPLSQGHAQIAAESAEAIKAILGINADLLAVQEGGQSSGRAIALRQRQGLLMVQELFDNLSRSRMLAGKFLLTQLSEIYDTETAKKVLGEAFLRRSFPAPTQQVQDPRTGQVIEMPIPGPDGQPMPYDMELADMSIAEVLSGDLGTYDVSVGESVSSETIRLANMSDLKEMATSMPGLIPPDLLIEESMLPQSTKTRILNGLKKQQEMQQAAMMAGPRPAVMAS